MEQVASWKKINSPYTSLRKPWKRDRPLGAWGSRATASAMGLKPESKLAQSAGPLLMSSSRQSLVVCILMHTPSVHADSCVQYIHVNIHTHTTGTCKHGQHAYRHTCTKYTRPCSHTYKYIQHASRRVHTHTNPHPSIQGQTLPAHM